MMYYYDTKRHELKKEESKKKKKRMLNLVRQYEIWGHVLCSLTDIHVSSYPLCVLIQLHNVQKDINVRILFTSASFFLSFFFFFFFLLSFFFFFLG